MIEEFVGCGLEYYKLRKGTVRETCNSVMNMVCIELGTRRFPKLLEVC